MEMINRVVVMVACISDSKLCRIFRILGAPSYTIFPAIGRTGICELLIPKP